MSKISEIIGDPHYCRSNSTIDRSLKENTDMVHHPNHYDVGSSLYEPYKVIAAWKKNFNIGNAIKYLARYEKKFNPIEDLEKAKQYIDFEIEFLKEAANAEKQ